MTTTKDLSPSHTCVDRPSLPCDACDNIQAIAAQQEVGYRRQRAVEPTIEIEDDGERARR